MSDFLQKTVDEHGVATLTMNRPETRNALSTPAEWAAFRERCEEIRADRSIRAVILTGAGPAFCAGGNVKHMRDRQGIAAGSPWDIRNTYRDGIQRIPLALYQLEVPTIAAINGPAIGAGLDLACMCDLRIASTQARFAESFVKLGIVPGDGGAWLLQRAVGHQKALEMALTGDMLDPTEALACGLVLKVVEHEQLMASAQALAQRIAANPSHALRMTKRLFREAQTERLETVLELSAAYQALAHYTEDHQEAVAAFLDKRTPKFKDR
jgi:enoyl-CoA hydratase/carnithine racemase